ncbi:hypothetical protein [Micromonospora craterilacus]|uniref:hypothetical protein n=1 Tax=Micromonospora craterilacus TaxID=1655439 RepID=UPI0011B38A9A|nr:hypothetical protein [Micromonospora craterilacus]
MTLSSAVRTVDRSLLRVEVDGPTRALFETPWTAHIRYSPKYGRSSSTKEMWALELASLNSLNAGVESVGGRERERFTIAAGELVIFDCTEPSDARWAALLGPWHFAHALFYEPQWRTSDIVETFSRLQWTDTPEGMTAQPGKAHALERSVYLNEVPGVGTLFVESKKVASRQVPQWKGYSAEAGEIWRLAKPPTGELEPLLYVTESAVATLSPWSRTTSAQSLDTAFDFLKSIKRIDWAA